MSSPSMTQAPQPPGPVPGQQYTPAFFPEGKGSHIFTIMFVAISLASGAVMLIILISVGIRQRWVRAAALQHRADHPEVEAARSCQEDDGPRQPPIEQVVIVEHPDGCQSVTIVRQELKPDATADGLLTELPPEGMLKPPS